ncbi:MAG: hypothetical protein ACOC2F_03115, partial [Bacteroidota bacterium]
GLRLLTRGNTFADYNMYRPGNYDVAIAPVWGLQRLGDFIHSLFDVGIGYSFDSDRSGMVMLVQMSVGINLKQDNAYP